MMKIISLLECLCGVGLILILGALIIFVVSCLAFVLFACHDILRAYLAKKRDEYIIREIGKKYLDEEDKKRASDV